MIVFKETLYVINDVFSDWHNFKIGSTVLRYGNSNSYLGIDKKTGLICYQCLDANQVLFIGEL